MRDRELMALAAEAVGKANLHDGCGGYYERERCKFWIPLDDDGDAWRLAMDLYMSVLVFVNHATVSYRGGGEGYRLRALLPSPGKPIWGPGFTELDKYAVVRRLIVEAAADVALRRRKLKEPDGA